MLRNAPSDPFPSNPSPTLPSSPLSDLDSLSKSPSAASILISNVNKVPNVIEIDSLPVLFSPSAIDQDEIPFELLNPSPVSGKRSMRQRNQAQINPFTHERNMYLKSLIRNDWEDAVIIERSREETLEERETKRTRLKAQAQDDLGGWLDLEGGNAKESEDSEMEVEAESDRDPLDLISRPRVSHGKLLKQFVRRPTVSDTYTLGNKSHRESRPEVGRNHYAPHRKKDHSSKKHPDQIETSREPNDLRTSRNHHRNRQ